MPTVHGCDNRVDGMFIIIVNLVTVSTVFCSLFDWILSHHFQTTLPPFWHSMFPVVDMFSVFGVNVNPSDSRAIKPVGTNGRFASSLVTHGLLGSIAHIIISICNSLSLANGNRRASVTVVVNLTNGLPSAISVSSVPNFVRSIGARNHLVLTGNRRRIRFPISRYVGFRTSGLSLRRGNVHVATLTNSGIICDRACCSVNNNFVISRRRFNRRGDTPIRIPCPCDSTTSLRGRYRRAKLSLSNLVVGGRLTLRDGRRLRRRLTGI